MTSPETFDSPIQRHLHALEQQRYAHLLESDTAAYSRLCHTDLVFVHSTGTTENLESFLTPIGSGDIRYLHIDHPVHSITVVNSTAILVGDVHAELNVGEQQVTLRNRVVATWVYCEVEWFLLSHAGTPLP